VAPLVVVAGNGGVGKTTTACALAIALADGGERTLLVSTDPAPSVSDALRERIGDEIAPVAGVERLSAQQLDASAAFARFRERYTERVDRLFDSLMRGGMDAAHDRQVVRDLLALAPPGLDELYALTVLGELLAEGGFERIVVDPAPTGHLLRLLELPAQAVEWTHRLLRLMLDYREVVPLGEAAEELLAFARRTRALDALLHDGAGASVLLVALDEPLVRDETVRLAERVGELGVSVAGVLWNRAGDAHAAPLPLARPLAQFESPETLPAPRGVESLRGWSATWRSVPIGDH
jgi:arsenite-transporting ATPase